MKRLNYSRYHNQRGVSLFLVLIMMLLTVTAVTGAFRVANLNEALLGNTSDYQRTYSAAETLLRDAEMDIRGRIPPYTTVQADGMLGTPCRPDATGLVSLPNFIGCRAVDNPPGSANLIWFPRSSEDYDSVALIAQRAPSSGIPSRRCQAGICVPDASNYYNATPIENDVDTLWAAGAFYGQFTQANPGNVSTNPILTQNLGATRNAAIPAFARYWVEVLRYNSTVASGSNQNAAIVPDPASPFVYRITVVAQGLKPGSRVVLRSVFVPNPASQNR